MPGGAPSAGAPEEGGLALAEEEAGAEDEVELERTIVLSLSFLDDFLADPSLAPSTSLPSDSVASSDSASCSFSGTLPPFLLLLSSCGNEAWKACNEEEVESLRLANGRDGRLEPELIDPMTVADREVRVERDLIGLEEVDSSVAIPHRDDEDRRAIEKDSDRIQGEREADNCRTMGLVDYFVVLLLRRWR